MALLCIQIKMAVTLERINFCNGLALFISFNRLCYILGIKYW